MRSPDHDRSRCERAAAGARLAAALLGTEAGFVAYCGDASLDLAALHGGAAVDRSWLVRELACLLQAERREAGSSRIQATRIQATAFRSPEGRIAGLIGGIGPAAARLDAASKGAVLDDLASLFEAAGAGADHADTADDSLLRAAVDSLPLPFWVTDAEGRYVVQNALDRSFRGNLIGQRAAAVEPPAEIVGRWCDAHRRVLAGETVHLAASRPACHGRDAVEVVLAPLRRLGVARGEVGLCIDNTERALIERQLQESRARLADYLDTASDWLWESDTDHRIVALDGKRQLGSLPDDQFLGRRRWELPGTDPLSDPAWQAHLADLAARRPFRGYVYRAATPEGRTVWSEVSGIPILDETGQFRGYRGTARDVTERVLAAERLQASEALLAGYLGMVSDWLWETGADHRITSLAGFPEDDEVTPEMLIGRRRWELVDADPLRDPIWRAHLQDLDAHRPFRGFVYPYPNDAAPTAWIELCGDPVFDADGAFQGYRGTARKVTERRLAEQALREAHAKLDAMVQSGLVGVTGGHGFAIEEANDAFLRLVGRQRTALEGGLDWRSLLPPERVAEEEAAAAKLAYSGAVYTTETVYLRSDGVPVPVLVNVVVLDGASRRWFALIQDLTPIRLAEARVRELAERDNLTGLANRHVLFERLRCDLVERRERGAIGALLLLDLDKFKEINDTLGHAAGDRLLQAIGDRLRTALRDTDTIARVGGDEFALVLRGVRSPGAAAAVAEKVLAALGEPLELEGRLVRPSGSIGISLLPGDGEDAAELMRMADLALYQAKARGGGTFCFFEPALLTVIERRRQIVEALQGAVAGESFGVALQPKFALATGARVGFEALVRWSLDGMPLNPDAFVGIAAESGSIVGLGRIVRRRAFEARARLAAAGIEPGCLALNVGALELEQPGFRDELAGLLDRFAVPADRLEVEVTEAVLLGRNDAVIGRRLESLRRLGATVTLDDFGTGYASLTQLKRFPVDRLKIDRSVIRDIGVDPGDAVLVRGIIDLAHTLELSVVAEGVETAEQLAFLIEHGCDFAQGYHLAAPLGIDELITTLGRPAAAGSATALPAPPGI